jgi:Family of unknown function (DUF5990)
MARELTLRIVVESPPPGVDYALQKGSGSTYETEQKQRSDGGDLAFAFTPAIREGVSDGMSALSGPFVQGPPRGRFVYIGIGTYAGQADSRWSGRMKVFSKPAFPGPVATVVPRTPPSVTSKVGSP